MATGGEETKVQKDVERAAEATDAAKEAATLEDPPAQEESSELEGDELWDCPCISKLKEGPCGEVFKASYECYLKSTADEATGKEKGSECIELFEKMQNCFIKHPEIFEDDEDEEEEESAETEAEGDAPAATSSEQPAKA